VVALNPFRNVDYWHMTRHADLAEYVTETDRGHDAPDSLSAANEGAGATSINATF
jgi:hypothetical protein